MLVRCRQLIPLLFTTVRVVRSAKKTVITTPQFSSHRSTMSNNKITKQPVQGVGGLSPSFFDASSKAYLADPKNKLACNALTASDWEKVVGNNDEIRSINPSFSKKLLPDMKSTSQRQSGRCWLFAVLNVMRREMVTKYNLNDDFELSQTYLFFYDKLEKCNYFLENIIATTDEKMEDRLLSHLVDNPIEDGGQWDMVVNIVEKYGVVPKYVMPDVEPAKFTRRMNNFLLYQLRDYAKTLREMHQEGTAVEVVRARKEEMMETVYRILAIHLGEPPQTFDWKVHDKDKKFLSFPKQTPQLFYQTHVPTTVTDLVCVVNDPRHPYGCTMTVQMLGNVQEGRQVLYLNLSMEDVIHYAKKTIDQNQPVWFGCDVGAESNVKGQGLMSTDLWDYDSVFGTTPHLSKADRLRYGQSLMTHAMVLTGYDEDDSTKDEPSQWRVENSWGDDHGDKGYSLLKKKWFREYVYEIAVHQDLLSDEHKAALSKKPDITLPPWDPMGALA